MILKGTACRYGSLAVTLHWLSAVAILALLALGFMAANAPGTARQTAFLRLHVPLGVVVVVLTLTRIVWWCFDARPGDVAGQPRWQALTAHVTHSLLYGLLIIMGASGIGLMMLSRAAPILFLGAPGPLPRFPDFPPMVAHTLGAFAMVTLLCLHTGAALFHQVYKRDCLFARMGVGPAQRRPQ